MIFIDLAIASIMFIFWSQVVWEIIRQLYRPSIEAYTMLIMGWVIGPLIIVRIILSIHPEILQ